MGLIKRFPIDGDEFYEHLHPYIRDHTRHFMHEFLFFARSPFCMETYDTKAVYEEASTDSSSNSDVVVVDDDDAPEAGRPGQVAGRPGQVAGPSSLPLWEEQLLGILNFTSAPSVSRSGWDSPTPGPSWDLGRSSAQSPVNVGDSSDSDASTIIDPSYVAPDTPTPSTQPPTRSWSADNSDGDEVIFVSYDKPWEERSPIQLSSGSDDEAYSKFAKKLKREHTKRSRSSKADRLSRSHCLGEPAGSSTPPSVYHNRSRSPVCRSSGHDQHVSSIRKSRQQDKHHRRKQRHKSREESHHSSQSGLSSSSRSTNKRCRPDKPEGDGASQQVDESHRKKRKHKEKHRKKRGKIGQQSRQLHEGRRHSKAPVNASSSAARDEGDLCKKHPSGHKKSCVRESGSRNETEVGAGPVGGHHSDGPMSDTSSGSSSSTTTVTATMGAEPSSAHYFSREQRVQQVMQARRLPLLPGMDVAPSWENISRLARLLASHTSAQLSNEPVIIASSDESEGEGPRRGQQGSECAASGDSLNVAKTVVVPCSWRLGVPTPAVDLSGAAASAASASTSGPIVVDECIDVDSISSDENVSDSEVVDVESLEDTEEDSSAEANSSSDALETAIRSILTNSNSNRPVTEVSAEVEHVPSPVSLASVATAPSSSSAPANPFLPFTPFSIESILNGASTSPITSSTSYFPSSGQMGVTSGPNLYSQLKRSLANGARSASLHGGIYRDEIDLSDSDSDIEIVPQYVYASEKAREVTDQGTAESSLNGTLSDSKEIDVVNVPINIDVVDDSDEEEPPPRSTYPLSTVGDTTGFGESASAKQGSPSQNVDAALVSCDGKAVDSAESAIGSSPVNQDDSFQREVNPPVDQQTAQDAGHSLVHQGVEASGSAGESSSVVPLSSSPGCDLPPTSAEELDISLGETEDNSDGESDISVGESDISVGDELLLSQDVGADEGLGTQQDEPDISDQSVAQRDLDPPVVVAGATETSESESTNIVEPQVPTAAATSAEPDCEDGPSAEADQENEIGGGAVGRVSPSAF